MKRGIFAVLLLSMATQLAAGSHGGDRVTVVLSHHNLSPERIEVHVGDLVTWRSERGEQIHLRFDLHPHAHEVTSRFSEVHAFFRTAGEHAYSGRIKDGRRFHGLVLVRERDAPPFATPEAQCDASNTLCIVP